MPPSVKKPSKYRSLWLVLIVSLVISVVGVGAYIIDAESKRPPSQVNALLTPTPAPREGLIPSVTPKAALMTYTDSTLHYSFRYPNSLTLAAEKTGIAFVDTEGRRVITLTVSDTQTGFIDPDAYESCSVALNDTSSGKKRSCVTLDEAAVRFGTIDARHFVYIPTEASGDAYDIYQTASPALQFSVTFASGKEAGEKLFREMLPTFTFGVSPNASASPTLTHLR